MGSTVQDEPGRAGVGDPRGATDRTPRNGRESPLVQS